MLISKWKTIENNHMEILGASFRVVWHREGGNDICYVVPTLEDQGNRNARLIAMAPELLEVCEGSLDIFKILSAHAENPNEYSSVIENLEHIINYVEKE